MKIKLTLTADIELNGESPQSILRHIRSSFMKTIGDGGLTGYSEAECNAFNIDVEEDS
jgi:hypothetical protein